MTRYSLLSALLLLLSFVPAKAQDTLWVQQQDNKPYLMHRVRTGENLFLLSRRYSVPPAVLADVNEVNYQDGLVTGSRFRIPVDKYNYIRIESMVDSRPLYYRAEAEDNLHSISRMFNVSQGTIQRWNHMQDADVADREVLLVGWIAYDKSQKPFVSTPPAAMDTPVDNTPANKDVRNVNVKTLQAAKTVKPLSPARPLKDSSAKVVAIAKPEEEDEESNSLARQFKEEDQGAAVTEESGAAVFYTLKSGAGVYYAFHNTARKGSVIKVLNPASNKMIYAKVIGPIPKLKEYHNAVVGISSNAMQALGARDRRMFCKLKYR